MMEVWRVNMIVADGIKGKRGMRQTLSLGVLLRGQLELIHSRHIGQLTRESRGWICVFNLQ